MPAKHAKEYPRPIYGDEDGTHVLTLPLAATAYDKNVIHKRFGIIGHAHNVLVKYAKHLLDVLDADEEYQLLKKEYADIAGCSDFEKKSKPIVKRMNAVRKRIGLTKTGLEKYMKVQANMFAHHISSQQMQKEADRVWEGVEKVLFGDGKTLHFKPYCDIDTICGKSAKNGVKFFSRYHNYLNDKDDVVFPDGQIVWNGMSVKVKIDYDDPYVVCALKHDIIYCEIKRVAFASGYRYYVSLYLKGPAPDRIKPGSAPLAEIDPGVSTVAMYSEGGIILRELAPDAVRYQKEIVRLQKQVDDCRRRMNPGNYNEDGTVKKGKHKWILSKTAKRKQWLIRVLHRREQAYRRCEHNKLANDVIKVSPFVRSEPMDFKALQKRAKKTERQNKVSVIKTKSGKTVSVRKYKRRKRFGRSTRTRAPSAFMSILERKANIYGSFSLIDTRKVKPSQYDHVSDSYIKVPLSQRSKIIGGQNVQRDLYAAFIGYCVGSDGKTFDRKKAELLFDRFVIAQNVEIKAMRQEGISMPHCFGF